jgi:ribosome maturation protein SDO1
MNKKSRGTDREKMKINVARMKKDGEVFEVIIIPEKAMEFRNGNIEEIKDVVTNQKIFNDAKKGLLSSETRIKDVFKVSSIDEAIKQILLHGEIQTTEEFRISVREQKRKRIIELIHRNAIDPVTKLTIPVTRIENGIEEAKIKIDENKSAEDQIASIVSKLKPIMPIKVETIKIETKIYSRYASKTFNILKKQGSVTKENWLPDNSVEFTIEIPAGMRDDFIDLVNSQTKGSSETKIIEK